MAESKDVCNTSQEDSLALEPSRDDIQGLETSLDSDILGGDDNMDFQMDDRDYLDGLALSGANLLSPFGLVDVLQKLGTMPPPSGPHVSP